jgi:hypothetical protein
LTFVLLTVMLTALIKAYGFPLWPPRYGTINLVLLWDEFISKFRFLIAIGFLSRRKIDFFVRNFFIGNQAKEMRDAV